VNISAPQLKDYIKQQLGFPQWDVELTDDQLSNCIDEAIRVYTRWKPIERHMAFVANDGISKITSTSTPVRLPEGTNGILDFNCVTNLAQGNPNIEAQMLSGKFAFYGVRSPLYDLTFYEYQKQWLTFAGRELSSQPEYEFRMNWGDDTLGPHLWIYSPGIATDVDIVLSINHTGLKTIPNYDEVRIRRLAMAEAKIVLGRVRSKYPEGFPAANQTVKLDGGALLAEGLAERESEEGKLQRSVVDQAPRWF
jgi:hypothetical protein